MTHALRVGNVFFDPFNIEIWCDSKKLFLKGTDDTQQEFLLDRERIFPISEKFFPYQPLYDVLHTELSFNAFLTFFKKVPDVQWSDLISEIPIEFGKLLFALPSEFWKSLRPEEYAKFWDKFSSHPDFKKVVANFLGAKLVDESVVLVRAQYPGHISKFKTTGDQLNIGDSLFTIDCMKIGNSWNTPAAATIEFMFFEPKENYQAIGGQLLYVLRYH
jgi:hypothetical protein